MQDFLTISEAETRRKAIRLLVAEFCGLTGISATTWERARAGKTDLRMNTMRETKSALVAEERRLLEYLITLHPDVAADLVAKLKQGEAA